jgi:hypothetical protein
MLRYGFEDSGSGSNTAVALITGAAVIEFTLAFGVCNAMFPLSTPYSEYWTTFYSG